MSEKTKALEALCNGKYDWVYQLPVFLEKVLPKNFWNGHRDCHWVIQLKGRPKGKLRLTWEIEK